MIGGVVVILPIVLGVLVVLQALQLLHRIVDPVAGALGFRQTLLATVATVLLLVAFVMMDKVLGEHFNTGMFFTH